MRVCLVLQPVTAVIAIISKNLKKIYISTKIVTKKINQINLEFAIEVLMIFIFF